MADILRKRLALFHPLNLDNSLNIGIDEGVPPAMDYILMYIYCQGCEPFLYSYSGSPEPNGEYSTERLTLSCMPYKKLMRCLHLSHNR